MLGRSGRRQPLAGKNGRSPGGGLRASRLARFVVLLAAVGMMAIAPHAAYGDHPQALSSAEPAQPVNDLFAIGKGSGEIAHAGRDRPAARTAVRCHAARAVRPGVP